MAEAVPTASPLATQASIDAAELALIKAKVTALEAKASTDWAAVKAYVKTNWPHAVTWLLAGATAFKTGVVADVLKAL